MAYAGAFAAVDEDLAVGGDVACRAEELDGGLDDAGDEEDEEDEAADHDDAGEQAALVDEDDEDEDVED